MKAKEIKFKGIRVDNGEWVYGDLVHYFFIKNSIRTDHVSIGIDLDFYDVIPETICQFTTLKDKNGVEIYDGDIVIEDSYPMYSEGLCNYRCVVIWNAENAGFELEMYQVSDRVRGCAVPDSISEYEELEIIGNIYNDKNNET